jgi:twitching motility protein PilT
MEIEVLLKDMLRRQASDLHIRVGSVPCYRINGNLFRLQMDKVSLEVMDQFLKRLMNEEKRSQFSQLREIDFAIGIRDVGRFRVNAYHQRGTAALAIRSVAGNIPDYETLKLPEVIRDLALKKRGLILVTGATGSGKSTTLASMLDHINEHTSSNIITIEDPVEFLHRDKRSIVSQRELGQDTISFANALRAALRQDPDVILIGEIRDYETMSIALTAADTGHLVMSTLHTMNVIESISRIISFYPPHQQDQIRLLLSGTLVAIISMRLLPLKDNSSRIPACEVMVSNANIRDLLLKTNKNAEIQTAIQEGYTQYGSQSFDQSILRLFQDEVITFETASRNATNPDDFELKVKGIEGTSDRSWMSV